MMPFTAGRLSAIAVVALLVAAPLARAQSWTGAVDAKWSTAGNWSPSGAPGSGGTATFDGAGNGNVNITLDAGGQAINTMQFTTAAAAYNLGVVGGPALNIDSGGLITVDAAVANLETISAPIATGGDLTIIVANSAAPASNLGLRLAGGITLNGNLILPGGLTGALTIDAPISGPGLVSSAIATGALNLNAQSTYAAGTFFNTTTSQPAIRLGVDSVGLPGSITSGPLGTGSITTASGNPAVFQPVGGDRTLANDWNFTNAIFVGQTLTAPLLDTTPHNLTLTGAVNLGSTGRVLTNNFPAGVTLNFGSPTVTSNISLASVLSFQTQATIAGILGGGKTVINDPIIDGAGTGGITVQNSVIVEMKNAANSYTGVTTVTGTGGIITGQPNPTLLVNGAKTGAGNVVINTRCNSTTSTDVACSAVTADPTKPFRGIGLLGGTGSIAGNVTNNGIIAPGAVAGTPGTLTLTGNLTDGSTATPVVAPSHWAIELSGALSDKLVVGGNIDLSAIDNLDITGTGSGTSWVIATYAAGTLTGTFDAVTPGYTVDYGSPASRQITLKVAGVQGDYNNNGTVDAADYVLWRKGVAPLQNEVTATTPGTTTPEDYTAWRARFGNVSGSGSASGGAVPEPATIVLGMMLAGTATLLRRRES